jgi:hypothetical protein
MPTLPPFGGDGGVDLSKPLVKKKKAVKSRSSSAKRPQRGEAVIEELLAVRKAIRNFPKPADPPDLIHAP